MKVKDLLNITQEDAIELLNDSDLYNLPEIILNKFIPKTEIRDLIKSGTLPAKAFIACQDVALRIKAIRCPSLFRQERTALIRDSRWEIRKAYVLAFDLSPSSIEVFISDPSPEVRLALTSKGRSLTNEKKWILINDPAEEVARAARSSFHRLLDDRKAKEEENLPTRNEEEMDSLEAMQRGAIGEKVVSAETSDNILAPLGYPNEFTSTFAEIIFALSKKPLTEIKGNTWSMLLIWMPYCSDATFDKLVYDIAASPPSKDTHPLWVAFKANWTVGRLPMVSKDVITAYYKACYGNGYDETKAEEYFSGNKADMLLRICAQKELSEDIKNLWDSISAAGGRLPEMSHDEAVASRLSFIRGLEG